MTVTQLCYCIKSGQKCQDTVGEIKKNMLNTCKTYTKTLKIEWNVNANVINTPVAETFPGVIVVRCNIKPGYKICEYLTVKPWN